MKIFGIIFIIVMAVSLAVFFTIYDSNRIDKLHKEYSHVTIDDEFIGNITDLYTEKGASFITINNSKKIFVKTSANYLYQEKYLDNLLNIGDTLVKRKGNDTLIVKKQNKEYYFVLGKFINKTKKH